jgi:hypothetical protein
MFRILEAAVIGREPLCPRYAMPCHGMPFCLSPTPWKQRRQDNGVGSAGTVGLAYLPKQNVRILNLQEEERKGKKMSLFVRSDINGIK